MSHYHLTSPEDYRQAYQKSIQDPKPFGMKLLRNISLGVVLGKNISMGSRKQPCDLVFQKGTWNITENLLDRHLDQHSERTAIIFEPNDPDDSHQELSYGALAKAVIKWPMSSRIKG